MLSVSAINGNFTTFGTGYKFVLFCRYLTNTLSVYTDIIDFNVHIMFF